MFIHAALVSALRVLRLKPSSAMNVSPYTDMIELFPHLATSSVVLDND